MQLVRKLALGVATVSIAFGAGHLVQSGTEKGPQVSTAQAGDTVKATATKAVETPASDPATVTKASIGFGDPTAGAVDKVLSPWARRSEPQSPVVQAEAEKSPAAAPLPVAEDNSCTRSLSVTPRDGAILDVLFFAPCAREARVVLRHGGLALSAHTTATGALSLALPALDSAGRVTVTLQDGSTAEDAAPTEMDGIRRFAVQWLSDDAIQLQIYENDAAFGAPGNVSAARPRGAGYLVTLGDDRADLPLMSEIYTYPAPEVPVQVTLEAEVTEGNCGREVLGQTLESVDGMVRTSDITLTMPGCEARGDILVLNNLVGDTTLAQAE